MDDLSQLSLDLLDTLAGKLGMSLGALCIVIFAVIIPAAILFYALISYFVLFGPAKQIRHYSHLLKAVTIVVSVLLFVLFILSLLIIAL